MSPKKEYGDFQTPLSLARRVVALLEQEATYIKTVIEPTCGVGAFLQAVAESLGTSPDYYGFDLNADYVQTAGTTLARLGLRRDIVEQRDFYDIDWRQFISEKITAC